MSFSKPVLLSRIYYIFCAFIRTKINVWKKTLVHFDLLQKFLFPYIHVFMRFQSTEVGAENIVFKLEFSYNA